MSISKANADPFTRRKTRHRGITYRLRADGGKTYSVYYKGRYWPVDGGEREAIVKQAERRAAGKTPTAPTKRTFADAAGMVGIEAQTATLDANELPRRA